MIGNSFLAVGRASTGDDIGQRFVGGETAQSACLPAAEVSGHGLFGNRFAEKHPRFVGALWGDADFGEFLLGVLGPITAAEAEVESHDRGANLVARLG